MATIHIFSANEFIEFLKFFKKKISVQNSIYEKEKLFKRFLERKADDDWARIVNWVKKEKLIIPHMDMIYSKKIMIISLRLITN